VKDSVVNYLPVAQVLDDNPLKQLRCDTIVPDPLRIDGHNWTLFTHPKARCLASFHTCRPKQEILSLEQRRKLGIQPATASIR
jgi:hypothetical protein